MKKLTVAIFLRMVSTATMTSTYDLTLKRKFN